MSFSELITVPFVLRAIAAAVLLSLTCGLLSFFIVQRRLAFMSHGIAHSMVAGVGLGLLMNWPVFWPALGVSLAVALGVGWIARLGNVSEDSAIGIALATALALGLVLISYHKGYVSHLEGYLLGSILTVTGTDLLVLAAFAAAILIALWMFWPVLLMFSFDPERASLAGYPSEVIRYSLLVAVAVLVVVAMKVVGILLVGALLVIPSAAAVYWSARSHQVLILSAAISIFGSVVGMWFSLALNVTAGGAIVMILFCVFLVSRSLGPFRK